MSTEASSPPVASPALGASTSPSARLAARLATGLRAWLGALRPDRLFFGPLFGAQMRIAGRMRGTYLLRSAFAALPVVLGGFIAFEAFENSFFMTSSQERFSNIDRLQSFQQIAPVLTRAMLGMLFFSMMLASPVFLGPTLGDDRRAGRLSTLLATPLRPMQIVGAKFAAQMTHLVILTLLAIPTLLVSRVFGGLSAELILSGAAMIIAMGALGASLSLLTSLSTRRSIAGGGSALGALIGVFVMPWFGSLILDEVGIRVDSFVLIALSSPSALFLLLGSDLVGGMPGITLAIVNAGYSLTLAALVLLITASLVRRLERSAHTAAQPPRRRASPAKTDGDPGIEHPVLWREGRSARRSSKWLVRTGVAAASALLLYLHFGPSGDPLFVQMWFGVLGTIILVASAAFRSGGLISSERESRTWEVLTASALSAHAILLGKFVGSLLQLRKILAVLGANLLLATLTGTLTPEALVFVPMVMIPPAVFITATGLLFSLRQHTTQTASGLNVALAAVIWAMTPFALLMTSAVGGPSNTVEGILSFHPVVLMALTLRGADPSAVPDGRPYGLANGHEMTVFEWALTLLIPCAVYGGAAFACFRFALTRFARWGGRAS